MWTAEKFLARLNQQFGDMLRNYRFLQHVDYVRLGSCADGFGHGYIHHDVSHDENAWPLVHNPNKKCYDNELADSQCETGATIMVIADCCGQYSPKFQQNLRNMYPHMNWLFPRHGDYSERIDWKHLADRLVEQGIVSET